MNRYEKLLSPLKIGDVIFKNRIFSAPIVPFALSDVLPRPTDAYMEHFVRKAKGGVACIGISGTSFLPQTNSPDGAHFDLYKYENTRALAAMADKIHSYGAIAALEDIPGLMDNPDYFYSASGEKIVGIGWDPDSLTVKPKGPMPEEIMDKIADDYASAAERILNIGYKMMVIALEGAPDHFLLPLINKRTDQYGGSIENRIRFHRMIYDRIRKKVGKNLLIWIRIPGSEKTPGGLTIEDSIKAIELLQDVVDIVELKALGPMQTVPWEIVELTGMPSDFMPPMSNVHLAKSLKEAGIKIPVMAIGGLQDPDELEGVLERGEADIIGMARGLIADPDLPNKLYAGKPEEVIPCVKCYHCVDTPLRFGCTVNPIQGRQHYIKEISPAAVSKKVAVVGGGPAGMEAAIIASARGHRVTLFEREDYLGGRLIFADKMTFKRGMLKFKNYLIEHVKNSNIEIKLGVTATNELLIDGGFENVIIAVGAQPISLNIEGLMENAIFAADLMEKSSEVKGKVAIIGGGVTGCETALYLARKGYEVTVLEYADRLCIEAHIEYSRALLAPFYTEKRITSITNAKCYKVTRDEVFFEHEGKNVIIKADTVILAAGMKSRTNDAIDLWQDGIPTVTIGDCCKATDVQYAIRTAYDAAMNI